MTKMENPKQYDLEDRIFEFAKRIRTLVKKLTKTIGNIEDGKQVIRSSGSVGVNYIEANESLSKKDFVMRIKICRKEAKERQSLTQEAYELMNIFGSILRNTK